MLVLLSIWAWRTPYSLAQEGGSGTLFVTISGGVSVPMGAFSWNVDDGDSSPDMIIGPPKLGSAFSVGASYSFGPRLGVFASAMTTLNEASAEYRGKRPWVCDPCGHGYISPGISSRTMEMGTWKSSLFMAGLEVKLLEMDPILIMRAAYGRQYISSPYVLIEETGTQLVYASYTLGFARSFDQASVTTTSDIINLGLALRHRLARRIHLTVGGDLIFSEVRFNGEKVYRFSGATQSDPDEHFERRYTYDQTTGTTRFLAWIGLGVELLRAKATVVQP